MPAREPERPAGGEPPRGRAFQRLRAHPALRELVAESGTIRDHLVQPLFVRAAGDRPAADGLPALGARGVDGTVEEAARLQSLGLRGILLFGVPRRKDGSGSAAADPKGPVPSAIRALRDAGSGLAIAADVCLCEYTDHGHCGVMTGGRVDGAATLRRLTGVAVAYAEAGADLVAPSAMMDRQVAAIRAGLDRAGRTSTGILAYAAKFASSLYGPFRDVAGSTPAFGDRRGYQMDPRNGREALAELRADAREGADILMVKPALPYLDVLAAARAELDRPLAAYHVSGEYALIRAAAARGWVDEARAVEETLVALRRAGADLLVTYFAGAWAERAGGTGP